MGAEDRELRDRLERLQVQTKTLRAQLEDPSRLDAVRAEVAEQLEKLKRQRADVAAQLALVQPQVEQARLDSLRLKRERAEVNILGHVDATARVMLGLAATFCAARLGVDFAAPGTWPWLGGAACAFGAAGFLAVVWRMSADRP